MHRMHRATVSITMHVEKIHAYKHIIICDAYIDTDTSKPTITWQMINLFVLDRSTSRDI